MKRAVAAAVAVLMIILSSSCGTGSDAAAPSTVSAAESETAAENETAENSSVTQLNTQAAWASQNELSMQDGEGADSRGTGSYAAVPNTVSAAESETAKKSYGSAFDMRAVWISQYELSGGSSGCSASRFAAKAEKIASDCAGRGLNTLIVQVHPNSDAFYESDIFPWSAYLSGTEGVSPGYDALEILLAAAKKHGLKLHAWINPFRVSTRTDFSVLSSKNPARQWYEENNYTDRLIVGEKGIWYNPSSPDARKLVLDCVREIINKYDVDGIHIDDYFYPVTDAAADSAIYASYREAGGTLELPDYRRECVNSLVSGIYALVKSKSDSIMFSISPAGDIDKNRDSLYADVEKWLSHPGFADCIIPQIYYGFENSSTPFSETLSRWASLPRDGSVKLCCGVAAYKADAVDAYAGDGVNEWKEHSDILARQLTEIKGNPAFSGFVFFSYSYIFSENLSENAVKEINMACEVFA